MLDRHIAPPAQALHPVTFAKEQIITFANGLQVYLLPLGDQEVFKWECIWDGGAAAAPKAGMANRCAQMLKRGTKNYSGYALNEAFDFHGAYWDVQTQMEHHGISVYSLCKHFPALLDLSQEIIHSSQFHLDDWEKERDIDVQKLRLQWEKTSFASGQYFRAALFEGQPLGRIAQAEDVAQLELSETQAWYQSHWKEAMPRIFLSGKIHDSMLQALENSFGKGRYQEIETIQTIPVNSKAQSIYKEKEGAMQSSIRYGKLGPSRKEKDYFHFMVANTLLGGFFGSRLQKNIREEKGFTYGISSSLIPLKSQAYWVCGTDVNKANREETLAEIRKEILGLQETLVPEEELDLVKNYLIGNFIAEASQVFDVAEKIKTRCLYQLEDRYYENFQAAIQDCQATDIQAVARKYWNLNEMLEVSVG